MNQEQDGVVFRRLYEEQRQANVGLLARIDMLKHDNTRLQDLVEALTIDLSEARK